MPKKAEELPEVPVEEQPKVQLVTENQLIYNELIQIRAVLEEHGKELAKIKKGISG